MANARIANTIYIDTAGEQILDLTNVKVAYIVFTTDSMADSLELKETASTGVKLLLKGALADNSYYFDFSANNILFSQGVYVSAISAGAKATIVLG